MDWRSDPNEEDFIKRVIGIGGDHVVCCDEQERITVNGVALDEPYVYRNDEGTPDAASEDRFDITVPSGRLWVMGDHRSHSGDSREQFLRATKILEAYEVATDEKRLGAVMYENEMIDEASRKMAEQIVAQGRASGLA